MNYPEIYQQPQAARPRTTPLPNEGQVAPNPYTATIENGSLTDKQKVLVALGLLGVVGVSIWGVPRLYRKIVSGKEELKSFTDGSAAAIAKQIKMAFDNDGFWGTDTDLLRETLVSVPSQDVWQQVVESYEKQYSEGAIKANLIHDLADELQSTELNEMMQIINAKPLKKGQAPAGNQYKAWAKRLKAAFDKEYGFLPGTDSVAVTVTLNEIPTQKAFINVGVEYKTMYGTGILDDLKAEGEFGQYDEWLKIIVNKKKS